MMLDACKSRGQPCTGDSYRDLALNALAACISHGMQYRIGSWRGCIRVQRCHRQLDYRGTLTELSSSHVGASLCCAITHLGGLHSAVIPANQQVEQCHFCGLSVTGQRLAICTEKSGRPCRDIVTWKSLHKAQARTLVAFLTQSSLPTSR